MYIVYEHITPSNKRYIGITCRQLNLRWRNGDGYIKNKHFYRAIQKYGWENIHHNIIATNLTKEEACQTEKFFIWWYQTTDYIKGYNNSLGGEFGSKGAHLSDTTRTKMSDFHKGYCCITESGKKVLSDKMIKNNPNIDGHTFRGKHHSEETKLKMRLAWERRKNDKNK